MPPPNLYSSVTRGDGEQGVIVSDQDPLKLLPLPWRPNNIKYASNEIYLDVIETIDATIDAEGKVLWPVCGGSSPTLVSAACRTST